MPLDFYDISDTQHRQRLFEIEHVDFGTLQEVLVKLKKVSGVEIDPYGTTRIYPDHVELIISLIKAELLEGKTNKELKKHEVLNRLLRYFETASNGLLVIGE
ncbi:hypothetical protein [Mucilaginibacter celer]|uniref:Uncharacterized protein n=1 Tax=Mucilaginibacter celer TaxID=2305508 RepID=A0A494VW79_9SPHI|nr:hypothetical protein [Mucilaginibacter celer]AYL98629.1 hypothetical protein HYN43_026630 [Mucilaginibacter celer]